MKLWTINRVLRWSGFRIVVTCPLHRLTHREYVLLDEKKAEHTVALRWSGLYGSERWRRWEPES